MSGIEYQCWWCGYTAELSDLKKNPNGVGYGCPRCCTNMAPKPIPPFFLEED